MLLALLGVSNLSKCTHSIWAFLGVSVSVTGVEPRALPGCLPSPAVGGRGLAFPSLFPLELETNSKGRIYHQRQRKVLAAVTPQ